MYSTLRIVIAVLLFLGAANHLNAQTTWTGTVSTAWNTAGNWSAGVPDANDDVTIPDVTNNPVISVAGAAAKSVIIESGGLLTINTAGSLAINGSATEGLLNRGTIINNGKINIGNITGSGASGLRNEAILNNNTGSIITIERIPHNATILQNVAGSTINNAGALFLTGTSPASNFGISNFGIVNNYASGKINLDGRLGQALFTQTGPFTNEGEINIGSLATGDINTGMVLNGLLSNNAGGRIRINRAAYGIRTNAHSFTNAGSVIMGDLVVVPDFIHPQSLQLVTNVAGGEFKGSGNIVAASFVNAGGYLAPGTPIGKMTFDAAEDLSNSTLSIDVNGLTPGVNQDQVVMNGAATLGGKLNLAINFSAIFGDQVTILSATSLSGTFSTVTGLAANWKLTYTANAVVLVYEGLDDGYNHWTGNVSAAWNNAGNWTNGVPGITSEVMISNVTTDPVISTTGAVARSIWLQSGGKLTINTTGALAINAAPVQSLLNQGTVISNGIIRIGNTTPADIEVDGIINQGSFTNNPGAQVYIEHILISKGQHGLFNKVGATFTNAGSLHLGTNSGAGTYGIRNEGTFHNNTGGQINVDSVNNHGVYNAGVFNNHATLNIGSTRGNIATGITNLSTFNNNAGSQINVDRVYRAIELYSNSFTNAGTFTAGATKPATILLDGQLSTGIFNNLAGALLKGNGTVEVAHFTNTGGALSPGYPIGKIEFSGSEDLSNSAISVDVNGIGNPGTTYDQLNINGIVTLGGTLDVSINYTATNGDQFPIVKANAISGTFSSITGLPANWNVVYTATTVSLVYSGSSPTTTWTGAVNTDWNNAGNWSVGIPAVTTDVTIPNVTNDPVINTNTSVARSVKVLAGGILTIDAAGSLTINGAATTGLLNQGTVINSGTIIIGNVSSVGTNGIRSEGDFQNKAGGKIYIDRATGTALYHITKLFQNAGAITIGANTDSGVDGIDNDGNFTNDPGGQINIDRVSSAAIYHNGTDFTNQGSINIGSLSGGNTIPWGIYNNAVFNNTSGAQIHINRVQSAIAVAFSNFANAGNITLGALTNVTTLLTDKGGDFSNSIGGALQGTGSIDASAYVNNGGMLKPGIPIGKLLFTGAENFSNSSLSIEVNGAAVAGTDFDQVVVNGTATLGGKLALTINFSNTNADQVTIVSATALSGTFTTVTGLPSNWKVTYTANAVILVSDEDRNNWTGNVSSAWNTSGNWSKNLVPGLGKSILLPATGVVRELTVNSGVTTGSVEIAAGRTLTINAAGILTVTSQLINNGIIKGTGTIANANFTNTGTIAPGNSPGKFSITGNFINQGTIEAEIGGTTAGTQYDQLAVTGTATLGGNLVLSAINGFKLVAGQSFAFLSASSITGQFAAVTWPAGVTGTVSYTSTAVVLTVASTLPLKLLSFTGHTENNKVNLQWKTAQEENTAAFEVERSVDGLNYAVIATVAAAGSGSNSYSVTDEHPVNGNNYYRLKMKDLDSRFTLSQVIQVKIAGKGGLVVAPVPANSYITLTMKDRSQIGQHAQVYNTAGNLLTDVVLSGTTRIDIAGWPAGIYVIKTKDASYRFVKQ